MEVTVCGAPGKWQARLTRKRIRGRARLCHRRFPVFFVAALLGEAVLTSPGPSPWAASLIKRLSSCAMNVKKASVAALDFLFWRRASERPLEEQAESVPSAVA